MPMIVRAARREALAFVCSGELAQAAEARNRRLRDEMKKRDREDRLLEKQRLRERRLKKRQKLRKSLEGADAGQVTLGSGDDFEASDSDDENVGGGGSDLSDRGRDESEGEEDLRRGGTSRLSLAEKEALALKLLGSV